MRLKIIFSISKLPVFYRQRSMSLIKEALEKSDSDYKNSLYPEESVERLNIAKPLRFGISMPKDTTIKNEEVAIDEDLEIEDIMFYFWQGNYLSFYLSSVDYQFITNLYNGLLEIKEFKFGNCIALKLNRIFMLNESKIKSLRILGVLYSSYLLTFGFNHRHYKHKPYFTRQFFYSLRNACQYLCYRQRQF